MVRINIVLVGYRATGKTTLGMELAKQLEFGFFDVDHEIEKSQGMSLAEIFEKYGEDKFREIEKEMIKRTEMLENFVVTTGGGCVMKPENRQVISQNNFIIWLSTPPSTIFSRIKSAESRPNLTNYDSYHEILVLLKKREPFYRDLSDIEINTGEIEMAENVVEIKRVIERLKHES